MTPPRARARRRGFGAAVLAALLLLPPGAPAQQADPPPEAPAATAPEAPVDTAPEAPAANQPEPQEGDPTPDGEAETERVDVLAPEPVDEPAGQVTDDEAAGDQVAQLLAEWETRAEVADRALAADTASTAAFEVLREVLAGHRAAARSLADRLEDSTAPLERQLGTLGPPPEPGETAESATVAAERRDLAARLARIESRARQAELARARADELIQRVDARIRERVAQRFQARGPSPLDPALWPRAVAEYAELATRLGREVVYGFEDPVRARQRWTRLPLLIAAMAAAPLIVLWLRGRAVRLIRDRLRPEKSEARRVSAAALAAATRAVLMLAAFALFLGALHFADLFGPIGQDVLGNVAIGLAGVVVARNLSLAWYAPDAPTLRISSLDEEASRRAARRAVILGIVFFADWALVIEGDGAGLSSGTLNVANLLTLIPGCAALWALSRNIAPGRRDTDAAVDEASPEDEDTPQLPPSHRLRALAAHGLRAASALSLILAAAGFFFASKFLFFAPVLTLALVVLGMVLFRLVEGAVDGVVSAGRAGDSLRLLPVFVGFLLFLAGLPPLALIWGARPADLVDAWQVIVSGVQIGDVRVSPAELITFFVVFGIGWSLTRLLQGVLGASVLPRTRLDAGGRTALTSGIGYVGIALAGLAAISSAGLDLSNLAIVAGALSVGIGFGLQTIVNNFVSGIILLVERPVKVGDWIEVAGVHGTVRRINVRATEIVTFDRSALILPNSQLISGSVTNYTHGSHLGRLIVPVGVAYGSDVRQVERILRETAEAERRVLQYPPPQVLFMSFGADALMFELRVILRDVNLILAVRSDLHFDIDRRFREAGIEIPFAQRVVHLRTEAGAPAPAPARADAPPRATAPADPDDPSPEDTP